MKNIILATTVIAGEKLTLEQTPEGTFEINETKNGGFYGLTERADRADAITHYKYWVEQMLTSIA